jgi:low temperature requirement protein LtrA
VAGLAKGLLTIGVLWWSWVGYAWLTSAVDPDEGGVRLVIFAAMAAFLVAALCVPAAFDDAAFVFAGAYAAVRIAHIGPLRARLPRRPGPARLRHRAGGQHGGRRLAPDGAAFADEELQGALWAHGAPARRGGPYFFGLEGWKLVAGHFAERHGLIIIVALGESIVAIGAGAEGEVDAGIVVAAALGMAVAAALWWLYFDVVALVAERRLAAPRPAASRTRWPATPTPTCTSRWSPGSCSWPSGCRRRSATRRIR